MNKTVYGRISHLSFTSSEWSNQNPILKAGEVGYDKSNKRAKIGDGATPWTSLPWASDYSEDMNITVSDFA